MRTSDFRNALHRVAADTEPLSASAVLAGGKRHQRRRRVAAATGAALAVLTVSVLVAVGPWRRDAVDVPLPAEPQPTTAVTPPPSATASKAVASKEQSPAPGRTTPVKTLPASEDAAMAAVAQRYEFLPETATMGPATLRTTIVDREAEGPARAISLLRTRDRFELPPPHPNADRHVDTTISGVPVRIDVLGAEQQVNWIQTGNLYVLTTTGQTEAETTELTAYVMQWYQRRR